MQGIATLNYNLLSGIQATSAMYNAAKILAEMGREEDMYVVHAAEGETVLPMAVMEANPKMAEMIYTQLREMGLDPQRYIVGNELNSINPETGMPEFFLSGLWEGIKKIAKVVLPIIATVWLTSMGIPMPISSAIVSGTSTAIQGGSTGDVLKSAAMGYAVGSVTQAGVRAAGAPAGQRISTGLESLGQSVAQPLTAQPLTFTGTSGAQAGAPAGGTLGGTSGQVFTDQQLIDFANSPISSASNLPPPVMTSIPGAPAGAAGQHAGAYGAADIANLQRAAVQGGMTLVPGGLQSPAAVAAVPVAGGDGLWQQTKDFYGEHISPSRFDVAGVTPEDIGVLQQYGPLAATVTGGAAALGAFDQPELGLGEEDIESYATTGEDLLYSQPDRYMYNFADFVGRNPFYQRGPQSQTGTPTPTSSTPNLLASGPAQMGLGAPPNILAGTPYAQSASRRALNAYIAGAREGGAINGAGSGQSDSIPAMLSDGEFVMTAKAVRNAGNGDRRQGAKKMYRMMHRLEGRG
jgi:hypothetical protein